MDNPKRPAPIKIGSDHVATGLTGDARRLIANQAAQLIDAEWSTPRVLLVTGNFSDDETGTWILTTGIDRIRLPDVTALGENFTRIVIARSVQLVARTGALVGPSTTATAIVTEIDATVDVGALAGGSGVGSIPGETFPNAIITFGMPVSVISAEFLVANLATFPDFNSRWFGVSFYNKSPLGRNLYLAMGAAAAVIANGGYSVMLAPDEYFETPFLLRGVDLVHGPLAAGIWDGADGSAGAGCNISVYAANPAVG